MIKYMEYITFPINPILNHFSVSSLYPYHPLGADPLLSSIVERIVSDGPSYP